MQFICKLFSSGIQEFVEAFTYYDYLVNENIMHWTDLQERLTYTVKPDGDSKVNTEDVSPEPMLAEEVTENKPEVSEIPKEMSCLVQPIEFMLGLADLSGEIMRKCINSLGSGDIDTCRKACNFVQHLYSG